MFRKPGNEAKMHWAQIQVNTDEVGKQVENTGTYNFHFRVNTENVLTYCIGNFVHCKAQNLPRIYPCPYFPGLTLCVCVHACMGL